MATSSGTSGNDNTYGTTGGDSLSIDLLFIPSPSP